MEVSQYGGAIVGDIHLKGGHNCDFDSITLLLNNVYRETTLTDCSFMIKNIPKGIYQVRLDAETLPLEYVPDNTILNVEVGTGTTTKIQLKVMKNYGVSGRIFHLEKPVSNQKIVVLTNTGETVTTTVTDNFGYYRVDKLQAGKYRLTTGSETITNSVPFTITDEHLFDINLRVD